MVVAMPEDFLVARNPEPGSTLPWLIRVPLGPAGIVLKARESWPRTSKVYCHRALAWPEDADVVERVPTRSCVRRGAAIDLVLDRGRENRSQLVLTHVRGREAIFWQTARTARQARPTGRLPRARAAGVAEVEIVVDSHERYAWRFSEQQAATTKRALRAGDYGIELDGRLVASVERKSLPDLVSTLTTGRMRYVLADLAALPRAAVVVEDRYSKVFSLQRVRPAVVADAIAECQARFPEVPIIFAENRKLAQEWTYRFLVAARLEADSDGGAAARVDELPGVTMPPTPSTPDARPRRVARPAASRSPAPVPGVPMSQVRAWAREQGLTVSDRGPVRREVVEAFVRACAG